MSTIQDINIPPILQLGARGEIVKALQRLLIKFGIAVVVDGIFGPRTRDAVREFQRRMNLIIDGIVGGQTWEALRTGRATEWPGEFDDKTNKVTWVPLNEGQYIKSFSRKTQIVLHHTAGNSDARGVVQWWNRDPSRVATAFVISGWGKQDGQVVRCFDDRCWAWHIGTDGQIDQWSVGIELCNWGFLHPTTDGRFVNYVGGFVPESQVVELERPWRGFRYFHAYTDNQIDAMLNLIRVLSERWGIKIQNRFTIDWFELNPSAQRGAPGLWNHSNFRADKTDLSPQPKLIQALNSIAGWP